jgi:hypothetical protein
MGVSKTELGPLREISAGAFGVVYKAPQYRLPGDPLTVIAYKEFTKDTGGQARSAGHAVAFRDQLGDADRADLDQTAVWPRALVEDQGAVTGFLMEFIPDEFRCQTTDKETREQGTSLRDLQWLIATPRQLEANGLPEFSEIERLALLGRLVYDIARLHRHGWVYGDLSFKNAAFTASPPRMILLDCDGAASERRASLTPAVHSLGWRPPECEQPDFNYASKATDVYKLGLAALRCLNPEKGAGTARDPRRLAGHLDPAGMALIAQAVDADPAKRPAARDLYAYFRQAIAARVAAPEVLGARLVTPLRVRGMDARVEWQIKNVTEVVVRSGAGAAETVPSSGRPEVHVIRSPASGPVILEAGNQYGTVRIDLGDLVLYDIPAFDPGSVTGALPRLAVPQLPAFPMDAVAPALASVPRVAVPTVPDIPTVPTADLSAVLRQAVAPEVGIARSLRLPALAESLRLPDLTELTRLPDLSALVAGPAWQMAATLNSQAREFAETRKSHLAALASAEDDD